MANQFQVTLYDSVREAAYAGAGRTMPEALRRALRRLPEPEGRGAEHMLSCYRDARNRIARRVHVSADSVSWRGYGAEIRRLNPRPRAMRAPGARRTPQERLAGAFSELLRATLTRAEMRTVRARNRLPQYTGGCASHDIIDANMTMADAFEGVMGRPILPDAGDPAPEDVDLWNQAWTLAREAEYRLLRY